ncbi:MAG: DUF1211 domain-containing protein [Thermomicrobiales bacterium]|nr:DUF1211 domain-containing protein [Thermomicrobiales bacterium]
MPTNRLEAFSDGVLAIIITIMVLGLKIPEGRDLAAFLNATGPGLLTYLLSFVFIGIYWNNHHHMFALTDRVTGLVLWANLHLLFWLSLLPFTTAWMDESRFAQTPVVLYGVNLLAAAIAYVMLQTAILRELGRDSALARAIGDDRKGRASPLLYLAGIGCGLLIDATGGLARWPALACYVLVALLWLVPDERIERVIRERGAPGK